MHCGCHCGANVLDLLYVDIGTNSPALYYDFWREGDLFWLTISPHDIQEAPLLELVEQIAAARKIPRADLFDRIIVLLTKCDEATEAQQRAFRDMCLRVGLRFLCVSAKTEVHLLELVRATVHMRSHHADGVPFASPVHMHSHHIGAADPPRKRCVIF